MGAARDFKFGVWIDRLTYKAKNAKVGQKGRGLRHLTYFYNFDTPSISLKWVKLETSNLVCGQAYKPKNAKVGQKGRGLCHMTYFYNFGTPLHIYGMGIAKAFKFGTRINCQAYKTNKRLCYCRGTARRATSVEILWPFFD